VLIKTLFILTIPYLLLADYCIEIDRMSVAVAQKKISNIKKLLSELPYPNTVVKNGYFSICTGKFKDEISAQALLPLTRSRYPKARVITSDNAKLFMPIQDKISHENEALHVRQDKQLQERYFSIEIEKFTPKEYKNSSVYIDKILKDIPFSEVIQYKNYYSLRTGAFVKKSSADVIYSVIARAYPHAKIVSYSIDTERVKPTKSFHVSTNQRLRKDKEILLKKDIKYENKKYNPFDIENLNGTISSKLMSRKKEDESLLSKYNDIQKRVLLNDTDTFSGFYLKTNTAWDALNNEAAYDVRLEWDMYDQGYYHSKRSDEQKEIEKKIELYRSLDYIQSLSREEAFRKMKYYLNSINSFETIRRLKVQENFLQELQAKYKARLITQYEYDALIFNIEKDKESLKYYHNLTLLKIPVKLWQLLNQIEYVHLKESEKLFSEQKNNSVDNKLYNTLVKKNKIYKSWSDKLRLNFYVGQRKMYAAQNQTLLGVDAKIPLTSYSQSAELESLQNQILKEQLLLKERQNRDNLTEFVSLFIYKQSQLKRRKEELKRLLKHIRVLQKVETLGYGELIAKRGKNLSEILLEYHDMHLQILLERFDVYKLLVEILYQTKSSDFSDLLEYALPDYLDHRAERI